MAGLVNGVKMKKGLFIIGIILIIVGTLYLISNVVILYYDFEFHRSCKELAQYSDEPYVASYYCGDPFEDPGDWFSWGFSFILIVVGAGMVGKALSKREIRLRK